MARLNHLMRTLLPRQMATAMIISLDADRRTVDIVNAGHLPPVVISPEGARRIEDSHHDSGSARPAAPATRRRACTFRPDTRSCSTPTA